MLALCFQLFINDRSDEKVSRETYDRRIARIEKLESEGQAKLS
jgi:hypothetical protein